MYPGYRRYRQRAACEDAALMLGKALPSLDFAVQPASKDRYLVLCRSYTPLTEEDRQVAREIQARLKAMHPSIAVDISG